MADVPQPTQLESGILQPAQLRPGMKLLILGNKHRSKLIAVKTLSST